MKENAVCKSCRKGALVRRDTSQSFERGGLVVNIEGIPALVCNQCGQAYYPPGFGDKISLAADHLFALSEMKHAGELKAGVV